MRVWQFASWHGAGPGGRALDQEQEEDELQYQGRGGMLRTEVRRGLDAGGTPVRNRTGNCSMQESLNLVIAH